LRRVMEHRESIQHISSLVSYRVPGGQPEAIGNRVNTSFISDNKVSHALSISGVVNG
jgi:hypothetical protein